MNHALLLLLPLPALLVACAAPPRTGDETGCTDGTSVEQKFEGELGAQPLVAEVCSDNWEGCTKVEGTIEVREAAARSLEARIVVAAPTPIHDEYYIDGEGRLLYAEKAWRYCW